MNRTPIHTDRLTSVTFLFNVSFIIITLINSSNSLTVYPFVSPVILLYGARSYPLLPQKCCSS